MTVTEVLDRLEKVRQSGSSWTACCPAHDDRRQSLTVGEGEDGRVLLHCHAGCPVDDVLRALDLRPGDLFTQPQERREQARIVATYDYRDEAGELLFQVVRFDPKDFRQRRPDGHGGWIWKTGDVRKVLYRLPKIQGADTTQTIFVVEGERDVESLERLGFIATCNPGGALKWRDDYSAALRGRPVVIIPDADAVGRKHAEQVARSLTGIAASVRVLALPGEGKDVSDWIAAGGTSDELQRLVAEAAPWDPSTTPEKQDVQIEATGGEAPRGYLLYTDDNGKLHKLPPAVAGRRYLEGGHHVLAAHEQLYLFREGCYRPGAEHEIARWVQAGYGTLAKQNDKREVLSWLGTECHREFHELYNGPWINVGNGLLDWQTGKLRPHTPEVLSITQVPTTWEAAAYSARADQFLNEVLPDVETRCAFEEYVGYILLGDLRYQQSLMLTGGGRNGKSAVLSYVAATLGEGNVSSLALQDLEDKFRIAELVGKVANICADISRDPLTSSAMFKKLVTGDEVTAERKYKDPFRFKNRAVFIFSANELPRTHDRTEAYWRRWIIVPCPRRFVPGTQGYDPQIVDKVTSADACSYLLRLAVEGLRRLVARGYLLETPATRAALRQYRREADDIVQWHDEACVYEPGATTPKGDIYGKYRSWCAGRGRVHVADSLFSQRLVSIEPRLTTARLGNDGARTRVWCGLRLRRPNDPPAEMEDLGAPGDPRAVDSDSSHTSKPRPGPVQPLLAMLDVPSPSVVETNVQGVQASNHHLAREGDGYGLRTSGEWFAEHPGRPGRSVGEPTIDHLDAAPDVPLDVAELLATGDVPDADDPEVVVAVMP